MALEQSSEYFPQVLLKHSHLKNFLYILATQYTPEWDGETTVNAKNELPIIPVV